MPVIDSILVLQPERAGHVLTWFQPVLVGHHHLLTVLLPIDGAQAVKDSETRLLLSQPVGDC